jgi:hypothetical protein
MAAPVERLSAHPCGTLGHIFLSAELRPPAPANKRLVAVLCGLLWETAARTPIQAREENSDGSCNRIVQMLNVQMLIIQIDRASCPDDNGGIWRLRELRARKPGPKGFI